MKQYSANIAKGKEVLEHFMAELRTEGITHVPRWLPSPDGPESIQLYVLFTYLLNVTNSSKFQF